MSDGYVLLVGSNALPIIVPIGWYKHERSLQLQGREDFKR
jgi:hypothetical protein